jgi:hypothetical protein
MARFFQKEQCCGRYDVLGSYRPKSGNMFMQSWSVLRSHVPPPYSCPGISLPVGRPDSQLPMARKYYVIIVGAKPGVHFAEWYALNKTYCVY